MLFIHKGIRSPVKRVEFNRDTVSCISLRSHWCDIVLNVHAMTEDKSGCVKDGFCEESEHIFNQFLKYHKNILLGDFYTKVGKEYFQIINQE
jgi:hypothetical protein